MEIKEKKIGGEKVKYAVYNGMMRFYVNGAFSTFPNENADGGGKYHLTRHKDGSVEIEYQTLVPWGLTEHQLTKRMDQELNRMEKVFGIEDGCLSSSSYEERMKSIIIRYEDVVDQIILRLDGRSFTEQAFHELTESCHSAAWDQYRMIANFEQKKDTLRFIGYFCSYSDWSNKWELTDGMKKIMRGALHYETGSYDVVPSELDGLLGYSGTYADLVELPSCKKLTQIKMFKKRRVDLKFASSECAEEFVDRYLGRVA